MWWLFFGMFVMLYCSMLRNCCLMSINTYMWIASEDTSTLLKLMSNTL